MTTRKRFLLAQLAFVLVMMPSVVLAQRGREFVAVEALVGTARFVHVGRIVELRPVDYEKPLDRLQKLGKPHRVVFDVTETIRGKAAKSLELILSLQSTTELDYLREHAVEVLLVGGSPCRDDYRKPEIGIEEQGKPVDDDPHGARGGRYQFHLLDPIKTLEADNPDSIAAQINKRYDFTRMFTNELEIVSGREEILKRARDFVRKHSDKLSTVTLRVPNDFGALCGDPNAFCGITLPICPETKSTLARIKDDPGLILRRIKPAEDERNLSLILVETHKALAMFPAEHPASGHVEPAQSASGLSGNWVDSMNGDLSLRLGVKSARVATQASIVLIAEIRNNRNQPITILRPFGDPHFARGVQIKIWNEQGTSSKYTGPKADYDLNAQAFMTLEPMATTSDSMELPVSNHAGTDKPGHYSVRYDYSYLGDWDKHVAKQGVKDIWHGAICSREVRLQKVEGVSKLERKAGTKAIGRGPEQARATRAGS